MRAETLAGLLAAARKDLTAEGIETAALDARLLLLAATGLTHEDLIATPDVGISPAAANLFQSYISRRAQHEPVSRILDTREFYGRSFTVSPAVLDPRPDTEVVVALALKLVPRGRFIDLGTGSGAIAVTLCTENADLEGVATDISADALAVARMNAQTNHVATQLHFQQASWFDGIEGQFDLIISNPPYIATDEALPSEVFDFDPHAALFAGADGLEAYRKIALRAVHHLTPAGVVVLEIGSTQAQKVTDIFEQSGLVLTEKVTDLAGHVRGLAFRRP